MTLITTALSAGTSGVAGNVEPGLLGFLVIAVLGLALVFLLRSMNKQFRKIGPKPDDTLDDTAEPTEPAAQPAEPTADHAQKS